MALTFASPMPASTQRAHFSPEWTGDRLQAIETVSKRPLGKDHIRAIDMNFQWVWRDLKDFSKGGVAFNIHWGVASKNNYHYILDGQKNRKMTKAELKRPISKWTVAQVYKWRRGLSKASARAHTYATCARYAIARGVVICAELKTPAFARAIAAKYLVAAARAANHPAWFMALWYLPKCRQKCAAIIRAGGKFAIIRNGKISLGTVGVRVRVWKVKPTRRW